MCLEVTDSTSVLVWVLVLSESGDSFGHGYCSQFPSFFDSSFFCVDGGWKAGSVSVVAGHTFQFIRSVTFLIANKLINHTAGALKTPAATLLPISARPPSLTENIYLLLILSIMELHNSEINYLGSEWMKFLATFAGWFSWRLPVLVSIEAG